MSARPNGYGFGGQNQPYNFRAATNPYGRSTGGLAGQGQIPVYNSGAAQPVTYQSGSNPYIGLDGIPTPQGGAGAPKGNAGAFAPPSPSGTYAPAVQPNTGFKGGPPIPYGGAPQAPYQPNTTNGGAWLPPTDPNGSGTPQGTAPPGMGWGIKPDGTWGWIPVAGNPQSPFGTFGGMDPRNPYGSATQGGQTIFKTN